MNKKVYVFISQVGHKKIKKVSLTKLISNLNVELYTKKLFLDKKEAIKFHDNANN